MQRYIKIHGISFILFEYFAFLHASKPLCLKNMWRSIQIHGFSFKLNGRFASFLTSGTLFFWKVCTRFIIVLKHFPFYLTFIEKYVKIHIHEFSFILFQNFGILHAYRALFLNDDPLLVFVHFLGIFCLFLAFRALLFDNIWQSIKIHVFSYIFPKQFSIYMALRPFFLKNICKSINIHQFFYLLSSICIFLAPGHIFWKMWRFKS